MLRVSLETSDPHLVRSAIRAFVSRGYVRKRRGSIELTARSWRCVRLPTGWFFEWVQEDDLSLVSPLTDSDVQRMRAMRASGMPLLALAAEFGCSVSSVSQIVNGQRRSAA